jgi:hypothetical protein
MLHKVKGHSGNLGNDRADALADMGRTRPPIILPEVLWPERDLRDCIIPGLITDCVEYGTCRRTKFVEKEIRMRRCIGTKFCIICPRV